ncbi:response regulator [bacterium]|nr:response regulator [bacterium]
MSEERVPDLRVGKDVGDEAISIAAVRDQLISAVMLTAACFALPAVAASLFRAWNVGWENTMLLHAVAFMLFLATALLRKRLTIRQRAFLVVSAFFLLGAAGLLTWGLVGMGIPLLITCCVISAIFFEVRSGVFVLLAGVVVTTSVGLGVHLGSIVFNFDVKKYAEAPSSWFMAIVGLSVFTALILVCLKRLHGALLESIAVLHERSASLERANEQLTTEIAERERTEEERARLETRLRQAQKMEAIGQLAGGMAHDFNNYLQAVSVCMDTCLDVLPEDHPVYADLEDIGKATERSAALTRQLLTFSRRKTLQLEWLDLNDVLKKLMKMLERLIGENVDLHVDANPEPGTVLADKGQIEQVLINLCINARDAMPEGGELRVGIRNVHFTEQDCESAPGVREGDYVLLEVSDGGMGMPTEIHERIFEPFFTTKDVGQGTGLGLSTVYAIVEQHGGWVDLVSEPGKGSRFGVYLPASEDAWAADEVHAGEPEAKGGSETIFFAEDDKLVRHLMIRVLERAGYRLIVAKDGEEAIQLLHERGGEIDLAILDVVMPKRSGKDVHDAIKAMDARIPVLFSSGYSYRNLGPDRLPEGSRLIAKPYKPAELLLAIRDMIERVN